MLIQIGTNVKQDKTLHGPSTRYHSDVRPTVYLAAPFFSEAEIKYNETIGHVLDPFFHVFLPQQSGCLMSDMINQGVDVIEAAKRVYEVDVTAIRQSSLLLIVLNGRAIDEGAAFELGYAAAIEKPCFALQTDTRFAHAWGNNPMIVAAVQRIFLSLMDMQQWASQYTDGVPKRK